MTQNCYMFNTKMSNIHKPDVQSKTNSILKSRLQKNASSMNFHKESQAMKNLTNITLSFDQIELKDTIMKFIKENLQTYNQGLDNNKPSVFIINGDAGTGKSVILNHIFNEIQKKSKNGEDEILNNTRNYLVVNHPEMLKLYHQISKKFTYILKSDLERPTSLINKYGDKQNKIDVLIIDEAHLLATSKDAFKRFQQNNHLEELLKISKVVIMVFDENQSLRMGSFWQISSNVVENLKKTNGAALSTFLTEKHISKFQFHQLHQQFRINANEDILNWIKQLSIHKNLLPLSPQKKNFNDDFFQLKFFEKCDTMYELIKFHNSQLGQCRILCTYDFPYRLDGKDYYVYSQSDSFKLRWDRYLPNLTIPWSEREDTIEEVGSVYTIQGFDLNYAGVILGRSIGWDFGKKCLKIKNEYYDDHAGFTKKANIYDIDAVKEKIILNSLNVLLSRGVKGLYIYAWDKELRDVLLKTVNEEFIIRG